ncbi:MAG: AAA family ATPase [Nitrospira sp.]|nr:AAA family ATPase [Nitrospira sp.]
MKTIMIVNSKGGVGKSNITRHIAVAAEQDNPGSVVLCDTDPQGSLADWWNARTAETPQLAIVALSEFTSKQPALAAKFRYLFFDTAAAHAEEYSGVLKTADLVVIPVIPSPDDVRSLNRLTLPVVKASGRPFVFVMSKARQRTRLLVSTIAALSEHGPVSPTIIEQREGYAVSALTGSTLLEDDPSGKGAEEMRHLWEFVKLRIDEKTKSRKVKEVIHV